MAGHSDTMLSAQERSLSLILVREVITPITTVISTKTKNHMSFVPSPFSI